MDKADGHDMMFLSRIGQYLSYIDIYRSGTTNNTEFTDISDEFSLSYGTNQITSVQKSIVKQSTSNNLTTYVKMNNGKLKLASCRSLPAAMYKRKAGTRSRTTHCRVNPNTNHCTYIWTTQQ
jgi:hypothetical protein